MKKIVEMWNENHQCQQVTVNKWVIEIQPIHSNGWFIQEQSIWLC